MTPGLLLDQLVAGLVSGMILFIIALGLSFTFGVLRVVNFAHGALYMVGAYVTWSSIARFGVPFWAATLLSVTCLGALGALIEMVLLRRIYRAELMMQLLLTFGLVYILTDAAKFIWGLEYHSVAVPALLTGTVSPGGRGMTRYSIFIIFMGLAVALALWLVLHRTRFGLYVRALTVNREITSTLGINVRFISTLVFAFGVGLAGLGGALGAPIIAVSPGIELIIVECFIVVVIGGLGSITGTLVASLIIGVVTALGISTIPQQALVIPYALMALILLVRPWGLFGRPE
jgi:branched-subunit amino acid ABC-type transport system permease component